MLSTIKYRKNPFVLIQRDSSVLNYKTFLSAFLDKDFVFPTEDPAMIATVNSNFFTLNATGALLFETITEFDCADSDLQTVLIRYFEVIPEDAIRDAQIFISYCLENNLILEVTDSHE